jgi:cytochrome c oxidase subunit 4
MANHAEAHDDHDHGIAHVAPRKVLLGTFGVLMVLTIVTVLATRVDFGSQMNLVIAMGIATVKATFVAMYFMHLRYDKPFHVIVIVGGLLAAMLFVGIAVLDQGAYHDDVIWNPDSPPPRP